MENDKIFRDKVAVVTGGGVNSAPVWPGIWRNGERGWPLSAALWANSPRWRRR